MIRCHQPLGAVELRTASAADLPRIADLARLTWRRCYPGIVPEAQIEFMLQDRYAPDTMTAEVASGRLTYTLLTVDGEPTAFAAHGSAEAPSELKLNQLYVHPDWQGHGLGPRLIAHVEAAARGLGRTALVLTVNRRNSRAVQTYLRQGFIVRHAADFDIGHGFVMEDYVMAKPLVTDPTPGI
jgi:GNAT superfamily N-acetyltransferase